MIPEKWLDEAAERIGGRIMDTPLVYDEENDLYLKWENHQLTGSFKVRGALNKVLCLDQQERENGLVAVSAGNHGQGVALAGRLVGTGVEVFVPEHAVPAKLVAMRNLGAVLHLVAGGYAQAEKEALEYARLHQKSWISPYNDGQVIAGQGTVGLEILAQYTEEVPYTCIVPAGGGGLVSGIGLALKRSRQRASVVAVQSEASPFLQALYQNGTQEGVTESASLADGLAGAVEDQSMTIPMVRRQVDGFVLVSEEDICRAIATAWWRYGERIEGSAAVALAAALNGTIAERPAVIVITGGNIEPEVHTRICDQWRGNNYRPEEL